MIPYILVFIGALARLIPHPPNFTPITAIALYGGAHLNKRMAFLIPLGALFLSDVVLGFYPGMAYVYGSFLIVAALGLWLKQHERWTPIMGATWLGSTFFYVVTCYGSWRQGGVIGKTFIENLIVSMPFYRNMLAGDLMYVGILFGAHKAARMAVQNKPGLQKLLFQAGH